MRKIIEKQKVNLSFFLMKKPIPYLVLGKSKILLQRAKKVKEKLLSKSFKIPYKKKYFFAYEFNPNGKKTALVVHGWMSETTHMMMHIKFLVENNYRVISVDLPGHGQSPGLFLSWKDAIKCLLLTQKEFQKFDLILGHSFGGGMAVNAAGISQISDEFQGSLTADKYILLSSALSIAVPVRIFSKLGRLKENETKLFEQKIVEDAKLELSQLDSAYLMQKIQSKSDFLLIHGTKDKVVKPEISRAFAKWKEGIILIEREGLNHVDMLYNESILEDIKMFLESNQPN